MSPRATKETLVQQFSPFSLHDMQARHWHAKFYILFNLDILGLLFGPRTHFFLARTQLDHKKVGGTLIKKWYYTTSLKTI